MTIAVHSTRAVATTVAFLLTIGSAVLLRADSLFTVNGSSLYVVNTTTMTAERLGSLGSYRVGGLALGADGQLFGISTMANQLVTIDIDPQAKRVTTSPINSNRLNEQITLSTDIACDPTDLVNRFFAVADFDPNTELFSIDAASAQTTRIANLGTGGIVGLAFDRSGQLWGIDGRFDTQEQLVKIDKTTGAVDRVGNRGLTEFPEIGGLAIGATGLFWALNSRGRNVELIEINNETGTAQNKGIIAGLRGDLGVFGLVAAIPEPSTTVGLILGTLGLPLFLGRRR
jgi:hypothetical protein